MKKTIANYVDSKAIYLFWAAVCLCVFAPSLGNDFLTGWDDQWMVFSKYTEAGWTIDNLWHIFTDFFGGQYAPWASISYLFLYSLFGYEPLYFHAYSLLWHIGCVCLTWKFISTLLRMQGGMERQHVLSVSLTTTLLFAIHPMNVESIAWISALKIPLYAFFYLLGLICYLYYIEKGKIGYYVWTLICFICSFWGKEQAVTFPLALLIVDWFTNRDMKSRFVWSEKMVFLFMAVFFGLVTIFSQGNGTGDSGYSFGQRIVFSNYAIIEYFTKGLFPIKLNYLYPFPMLPGDALPLWFYTYPVLVVCLIAWGYTYRRNRYLMLGICLFLVNLVLSIHLIPMSRHAIVADRYLYLSYIGIAWLIADGVTRMEKKHQWVKYLFMVYVLYLASYTFVYTKRWENTSYIKSYIKELLENRKNTEKEEN